MLGLGLAVRAQCAQSETRSVRVNIFVSNPVPPAILSMARLAIGHGDEAFSGAFRVWANEMGLQMFKPQQKEAVRSVLCGKDAFVTLIPNWHNNIILKIGDLPGIILLHQRPC